MTNEEINIRIAEACGWLKYTQFTTYPASWGKNPARYHTPIWGLTRAVDMTQDECTKYGWQGDGHISINNIPNYCNDLNAMHEEIMSLEGPIRDHSFRRALAKSVGVIGFEDWEHSLVCLDKLTNATARQRAEAFLRTIGKWKE